MVLSDPLKRTHTPYAVTVEEYKTFRRDGYLIVKGLVSTEEVQELMQFMDDLTAGRTKISGLPSPPDDISDEDRRTFYERVHMPHRSTY